VDENLRDYVLHTVVNSHLRAVCPSFGVSLLAVARHAAAALRRTETQQNTFIACRVAAVLAVGLGIWTGSPIVAVGLLIPTVTVAYGVLAWRLREDQRCARDAFKNQSPPADQVAPLEADVESRLQDVEKSNVIVYAEGQGDPFIGSGQRLHYTQLQPVNIVRPATNSTGVTAALKPFDVITLHAYLAKEILHQGLSDLQAKNRLYVRGDYARHVSGLLPDEYSGPRSRVSADQVRSGAMRPSARVRTYVCIERVREGGQLVIGMYVRAELERDLLTIERSVYFLPPIQNGYRPTRGLDANDFTIMTLTPLTTAARRFLPMLMGQSLTGKERRDFGAEREKDEKEACRLIKKGFQHDYGAPTSLREAVAAYGTKDHFDQSDILRDMRNLDSRLLDLIKKFLDDHGVDTSDFSKSIQQVNNQVMNIQNLQAGTAVVGGQGNLVTGHGQVNNFGSAQKGGSSPAPQGAGFAGPP
jgi:hypothetical protein